MKGTLQLISVPLIVHETLLSSAVLSVGVLAIYINPIRSRIPIIAKMFASFDRPEDRPHTLSWLSTQVALGWMIAIAMGGWLVEIGLENLLLVPILVNGIGDGLAEPIGIRFGKHKYQTYALLSKKKYVRSLEGSACVFITALIVFIPPNKSPSH